MSRQVLVAGIHRSGTSALVGVLNKLGVPTGPMAPPEASHPPSNPLGQYEDDEFVCAFTSLLGDWRSPDVRYDESAHATLARLVVARDSEAEVWALKTPQLCLGGVCLLPHLSDPWVLTTARDFDASVASLMARDGWPRPVAAHLQSRYLLGLRELQARCLAGGVPVREMAYEGFVEEPDLLVDRLAAWLNLEPTDEQREAAVSHIDPSLRHH